MPQTVYNLDMAEQTAGQIVERGRTNGRFTAAADLPPGRILDLDGNGRLRLPAGTTLTTTVGASPYLAHLAPQTDGTGNIHRANAYVPVLRGGQIWVEYSGTAPTVGNVVRVMHSSTTATHRGKVTASAASGTAGSEISNVEGLVCMAVDTAQSLCLVEINLPA
jgi:hypothetical protein